MTRVFLVRHGETEWNASRRIQGQLDVPLSEHGRAQAQCVSGALAAEPLAAVYASDLSRAVQTAEAIALPHCLPVQTDARLREADFGPWEGLNQEEIAERYPEEFRLWRENSLLHRPPGGETIQALQVRAAAAYDAIVRRHPDQSVVIVGHGGSVRVIVLYALRAPLDSYPRLRMRNCSLTLIEIGERGPVLQLYDHVCYMGP